MIIVLLGASGTGKSRIENGLNKKGYKKIISYTTREPRINEKNHRDYHFVSNERFNSMLEKNYFAEHEEYSQHRLYGTSVKDYTNDKDRVVVLTPNGLKQLKKNCPDVKIFSVLIEASLGTRVKRYINRCGVNKFNYDDMAEINARINRDFGMLLGIENEVDFIVSNNDKTNISEVVDIIMRAVNEKK